MAVGAVCVLGAAVFACSVVVLHAAVPPVVNESLAGRQVFPISNWWNTDVTAAPVDARSAALISFISGRTATNPTAVRRLHPDFGPPPYGFPYIVVAGDQARVAVTFTPYGSESDAGAPGLAGYPIPAEARTQPNYIEGGVPGGGSSGDRHVLVGRGRDYNDVPPLRGVYAGPFKSHLHVKVTITREA